jgi:formate dehydrogenase major subunit
MSYARLEALGGIPWPCPDEESPGSQFLHGRLWADPVGGPLAPFQPVAYSPPVDQLTEEFPLRLNTRKKNTAALHSQCRNGGIRKGFSFRVGQF